MEVLYRLSKTKVVEVLESEIRGNPLDEDSDDDEVRIQYKEVWEEDAFNFYVLNISDMKTLTNGFRYIKELLLQMHNFKMYSDYLTLKENDIDVYSVKTDAFTIGEDDVVKAQQL